MIRVRGFSNRDGASMQQYDIATYTCDFATDKPVKDAHELIIVPKRQTFQSTQFVAPQGDGNAVNWANIGWGPLVISFDGCTGSIGVLDVEYVVNYELQFADGEGLSFLTTKPEPTDSWIQAAADKVTNILGPIFRDGLEDFRESVLDAVYTAGRETLTNHGRRL